MKKIILTVALAVMSFGLFAQAPQKMSYQAVVRDNANALVSNSNVGMQISILQGSASGTAVYVETQTPTSNTNGLVSLEIGEGTVVSGDFSTIDWGNGPYFIKTETDPTGGTNYTITGTSQLMSVPYALYAETSGTPGSQGPQGEQGPQGPAGQDGADGKSAYEVAVENGFVGTETAWLASLQGAQGPQGPAGEDGVDGQDGLAPDGTAPGEMLYWNGTAWVDVAPGSDGDVLKFIGGKPMWLEADAIYQNGFIYKEVTSTTGKVWLDRNLGATQVATSSTDADSYGDLYQWGRGTDGHQIRTSGTTTTLSSIDTPTHGDFILSSSSPYDWRSPQNDNLWQGVSGINNPCPSGFRLPTETELNEERQSWSSNNAAGAFASPLKLPLAGFRSRSSGSIDNVGSGGGYWSSTVSGIVAGSLGFSSSAAGTGYNARADGYSVRCLKD